MEYRHYGCTFTYDDKTYALLEELYQLLSKIKPHEKHGNKVWSLWLRAERGSLEDYGNYEEFLEEGIVESYEEFEQNWKDEFPNEVEWLHFQASYDAAIDYRTIFLHHQFVIEQDPRKERGFENDISEFAQWLLDAVKMAIAELKAGTYNAYVQKELPPQHRIGTVLRKYIWEIAPQQRNDMIGNMTEDNLNYFLQNAQSELTDSTPRLSQLTANDFYHYCAMGYTACEYDDTDKTPKEQYNRYADGRDDGLGEIDPDDP